MSFMDWMKPVLSIIEVAVGIAAMIILVIFSMKPTDTIMLTNGLLAILILVQLFIVNILLKTHEKGGKKR